MCFFMFYNNVDDARQVGGFWLVVAGLSFVLLVIPGVWAIVRQRRVSRPTIVTADEDGLRWTRFGLPKSGVLLRWSDIRSFATLRTGMARISKQKFDFTQHIFVVDGGDFTLAWYVKYGSPDAELQASDSLTHLIFVRTGLPLRELAQT
jgi:hypothetical protein